MASHHRASMQQPETYFLAQGSSTIPNSHLPVLVYRACISTPVSVSSISESFSVNHWLPGGVFKHYPTAHFHSVTHECYAVVKGSSRLLLGSTPSEHHAITGGLKGVEVILKERDAIVLPAGVAHCCLESFDEYEYVGLYPEVSLSTSFFCSCVLSHFTLIVRVLIMLTYVV